MDPKAVVFIGMGFELLGVTLGALYLGKFIDERYGFNGIGTAGLCFIVLIGWLYHLVILLKRYMEIEEKKDDK